MVPVTQTLGPDHKPHAACLHAFTTTGHTLPKKKKKKKEKKESKPASSPRKTESSFLFLSQKHQMQKMLLSDGTWDNLLALFCFPDPRHLGEVGGWQESGVCSVAAPQHTQHSGTDVGQRDPAA